jgi:hypothetical protein
MPLPLGVLAISCIKSGSNELSFDTLFQLQYRDIYSVMSKLNILYPKTIFEAIFAA